MLKKLCSFGFFLILTCKLFAQALSPDLPTLVPVTPTAAHLIKVGMGDANKATGAATANFPLYELHIGNLKMPIGLSYFSQGNKTEEQCTRAGFGWSLNAGGVITRKVNGVADDLAQPLALPTDLSAHSGDLLTTFQLGQATNTTSSGFDAAPDEFMFNFNGISSKFMIDADGSIAILSHQNLKITVNRGGTGNGITTINIVTPDGIEYKFGGEAYDRTTNEQVPYLKTAFYLNKVTLPTGQTATLTYEKLYPVKSETGFTETVVWAGPCTNTQFGNYPMSHTWSSQYTETEACILKHITTSDNTTVDIDYELMPDLSNDKRITTVRVHNQNGKQIKHYTLSYIAPPSYVNNYPNSPITSTMGRNGRFYLTNIAEGYLPNINDDAGETTINYPIDYYGDIANEDLTRIYAQDQFGFKNGKNNQSLLPSPGPWYETGSSGTIAWANRGPDWNFSVLGMLHTISYPTKGKEEFFYEPNTVATMVPNAPDLRSITWQVTGGQTSVPDHTLEVNHNQVVHLNIVLDQTSQPCNGNQFFMDFVVSDNGGNFGSIANYHIMSQQGAIDFPFNAEVGHTYLFHVSTIIPSIPSCNKATFYVFYDATLPGTHPVNQEAGGVRVRKITQSDQFGAQLNKFFLYTSLDDRISSTGNAPLTVPFESFKRGWICQSTFNSVCEECRDQLFTSNGIYNIQKVENSHIYYSKIIEADDSLLLNGGTEYTFYGPTLQPADLMRRGAALPEPANIVSPEFAGMVQKELVFDKDLHTRLLTENTYELFDQTHPRVRTVLIRKMYNVVINTSAGGDPDYVLEENLKSFNVSENWFRPGWVRLHDTKVTQYDNLNHAFLNNTNYIYGNPVNILPAAITTTDSKGNTITAQKKYPTDFPSDPVLAAMTAANMITPHIEESTLKSGIEIQKMNAAYNNNGINGGGFQPLKIQQKQTETNAMEDRILFSAYDNLGNLKEVSKALDGKISYMWDYRQSMVTAEVKNAAKDNIGYTSFEAESQGNFKYNGIPQTDLTAPTGSKVYDITGVANTISFPVLLDLSKSYIVSYWSKNGSKTIPGTTSVTTGRYLDGWTYYEHTINIMPAGNTMSGSGVIDELRLYPSDAMMTTFTYEPLIGMTSQSDINNRTSYYEYDGLGRLLIIRNQDKNIVKKICYNYAGQPENCSGL